MSEPDTPADKFKQAKTEVDAKIANSTVVADTPTASVDSGQTLLHEKVTEALTGSIEGNSKYSMELDSIIEWAKANGAKNTEDIVWEVRHLLTNLGSPKLGDNPIRYLYRYVFLVNEKRKINKELQEFENVNT